MNNGKVRIYELSKELDLDNKDILAVCERLDIAVKSHSSTISEEEAGLIRSKALEIFPSGSATAQRPASLDKRPRKPSSDGQKQQILEIRSHYPSSNDPDSQSDATLVKPPTRPVPSPSTSPTTPSVTAPTAPVPATPSPAPKPVATPAVIESKPLISPSPTSRAADAPTLQGPPQRSATPATATIAPSPQVSGADGSRKSPSPKPQSPNKNGVSGTKAVTTAPADRPVLRPKSPTAAPSTPGDSKGESNGDRPVRAKPIKPVVRRSADGKGLPSREGKGEGRPEGRLGEGKPPEKKVAKPPQVMELRRPRPLRPNDPPVATPPNPPDEEETDTLPLDKDDTPELNRPRRSIEPPRTNRKVKVWESEEEDEEKRKALKAGTKTKRRPHIIDEDEDDPLNALNGDGDGDSTLNNLSLVRPPKPKSTTAVSKPTPTSGRKPRSESSRETSRQRRERQMPPARQRPESVVLAGGATVQQLADLLVTPETDIIRTLFFKGIMANITQTLDLPTIELVAKEFGVTIEKPEQVSKATKVMEVLDLSDMDRLKRRPPVVTVMGHVDHGKTTLLDSIRKTKVAQGEAGGITQHIGAYHVDVEHGGLVQQVVFLDTPGHEAFTAMRARGARVTDIAILVVAADDGVRPQTIEAISHAKAAKVPIIVAINKVDKEDANPDRVKQELMEHGLVPEEWGGDAIMVPVSAIKGENLDTLLEMILLVSEVEELSANPDRAAKGTIIEAHLDKARGPVASLLVQNGTLKVGDVLVAGSVFGKVRAMIDDQGNRVDSAAPSVPVEILGLSNVPAAGHEFEVFLDEKEARSVAITRTMEQRTSRLQQALASRRVTLTSMSAQAQEGELKELNLLLKADVQGSLEAILGSLDQLPQKEVQLRTLLAAPGEISETDVDLAAASGAVILGFNTTLASGAKRAADEAGVDVREYDIIYKLLEDVQGAMEGLLEPEMVEEPLGQAEVRAVFAVGRGSVAGCYVQSGKLIRNCNVRVHRGNTLVYTGNLDSLRRIKDDVKEVNSGYECGVSVDSFNTWQDGDIIESYRMATKRRTLSA